MLRLRRGLPYTSKISHYMKIEGAETGLVEIHQNDYDTDTDNSRGENQKREVKG